MRGFLGLGSNLGDRLLNLQRAVEVLDRPGRLAVLRSSRVYESAPIGPAQPDYLNAVVEVETDLDPKQLLAACQEVEATMGRTRAERWGPRVIDVDILTYGSETVDQPGLTIPHPRMHERAFVLIPLLELRPAGSLPSGVAAAELGFDPGGWDGVRLFAPPLPVPVRR